MYEHFFNLTTEPFRLSPDHRFCFRHRRFAKARAYMAYAFMRAEGFVMVTGPPGTGKTTLIGDLVENLADQQVQVANLVSTQVEADDLLRMVAFNFGIEVEGVDKSTLLQRLSSRFLSLSRQGRRALLIVDEAQDLKRTAMEELRLLTNLQKDGRPLLQVFLLGQPELKALILDPTLQQVHQRILAASHLEPLGEEETREYVEHRLRVSGWDNDPALSTAIYPIVHQFSGGTPRRINLICSRMLLHAYVEQRHSIGVADLRAVVEELQEEQLSPAEPVDEALYRAEDKFEAPETVLERVEAAEEVPAPADPGKPRAQVKAKARAEPGGKTQAKPRARAAAKTAAEGANEETAEGEPGVDLAPPVEAEPVAPAAQAVRAEPPAAAIGLADTALVQGAAGYSEREAQGREEAFPAAALELRGSHGQVPGAASVTGLLGRVGIDAGGNDVAALLVTVILAVMLVVLFVAL